MIIFIINRMGKMLLGAGVAGLLFAGFAMPASAAGPGYRHDDAKTGVTLKVQRPGFSIILKKGETPQPCPQPVMKRGEWRKHYQHRDGWRQDARRDDYRDKWHQDGDRDNWHRDGDRDNWHQDGDRDNNRHDGDCHDGCDRK